MSLTDKLILNYLCKSNPYSGTTPVKVLAHSQKYGDYMTTKYKKLSPDTSPTHNTSSTHKDSSESNFVALSPSNYYLDKNTHKVYSLSDVENYCKKHNIEDIESFAKRNFFIDDGENTTTYHCYKYRGTNKYDNQRFKEVHKPVIEEKLREADTPPADVKPICFLFGGGSGAGKSTIINSMVQPLIDNLPYKFANLDCDELKDRIPEYKHLQKSNWLKAASRVHTESSDLCNECIREMVKNRKCFTYDGTMSYFPRYLKLLGHLKKAGYEVHVIAVDVPTEVAINRAKMRTRHVPEDVIRNIHINFAKSFFKILGLPIDSYRLFDNSQDKGQPPKVIMSSDGDKDPELYHRFVQKSKEEVRDF